MFWTVFNFKIKHIRMHHFLYFDTLDLNNLFTNVPGRNWCYENPQNKNFLKFPDTTSELIETCPWLGLVDLLCFHVFVVNAGTWMLIPIKLYTWLSHCICLSMLSTNPYRAHGRPVPYTLTSSDKCMTCFTSHHKTSVCLIPPLLHV